MTGLERNKSLLNLMEKIRYQMDTDGKAFVYGLRKKDTIDKNPENSRLMKDGWFFTGNGGYISISLSSKSAGINSTNTVYLNITRTLKCNIEIVYQDGDPHSKTYDTIASNLGISNTKKVVNSNVTVKNTGGNETIQITKTTYNCPITNQNTKIEDLENSIRIYINDHYNDLMKPLIDNNLDFKWEDFKASIKKFSNLIETTREGNGREYYRVKEKPLDDESDRVAGQPKDDTSDDKKNHMKNKYPLNIILYGPPGTGKTYNTVNKALEIILGDDKYDKLKRKADEAKTQASNPKEADKAYRKVFTDKFNELKNDDRIVFTTFHQSMSYEDFIEGIKPETYTDPSTSQKTVTYPTKNGIFKQFCYDIIKEDIKPGNKDAVTTEEVKDTILNKEEKEFKPKEGFDENSQRFDRYVLIIDEINRGNVSQIFGELITLIEDDKRLGMPEAKAYTVTLPYSNEVFSVPKNLYIIGTMNTADRSVEALDTALRRRFSFEEMMPDYNADGMDTKIEDHTLEEILKTINERIEVLKGREQQIGHSYLMKCETPADVKAAFKDKIVPLLQEYFYGDYSQIALVLGPDFVKKINKVNFPSINGVYGPEQNETRYRMLKDTEWKELDLKEALDHLLNKQNQKEQQEDDQTDENS